MALINWSPALAVGVKTIDDQHQKLIELVNQLNDAMLAGKGKEVLTPVLNELVRYTVYHFGTEEKLMAKAKYEMTDSHKGEHKQFISDVGAFKAKFDSGNAMISSEIMNFLRNWLSKHIMQTDKKLGQALQKAGITAV